MKIEDILRITKNIEKSLPYNTIREANRFYESMRSQMYNVDSMVRNLEAINSGLYSGGALSYYLHNVDALSKNFRVMNSYFYSISVASSYLYSADSMVRNLEAINSGLYSGGALSYYLHSVDALSENFRVMNSVLSVMEQSRSSLMKNLEIYNNIVNFVSNLNYVILAEEYEKRFLEFYSDNLDVYIRDHKWILPKFSTRDFITSLKNAMDNDDEIDIIFVNFFKEDNFKMLSKYYWSWVNDDIMSKGRLKVINSTIKLIKNDNGEKYCDLIIPSLIAQIDNLITQILFKNGYREDRGRFFRKRDETNSPKGNHKTFIKDFAGTIIDDWDDDHVKFLLESLFQSTQSNNVSNNEIMPFNRHNIMHGSEHDYGTFENVIRCFLIIDFLNDFLSDDKVSRLNNT